MLDRYIGESMVLIINMNNSIKEPIRGYQNCNLNQILMFGEYVKMRESLYTRDIVWVNTILNHIDIRMILPSYESSCMMCTPKWYQRQKKYCQIFISIRAKNYEIFIIDTQMVLKKTIPIQHYCISNNPLMK